MIFIYGDVMTIDKDKLIIWLRTTEEEVLRLQNCRDYINKIYYKKDELSYHLHEDLLDLFGRQINKNKAVIEFINTMIDCLDDKRLDTLLEFRDFVKTPMNGLHITHAKKLNWILMTPSTELKEKE